MKKSIVLLLCLVISLISCGQEYIELPYRQLPNVEWQGDSKNYFSPEWDTQVVTNVSVPVMEAFVPENPNGTAVIVAPGGGLYAHSINSEGNDVAQWLNTKGITAFVLQYRLVPTGEDGVKEINEAFSGDVSAAMAKVAAVLPYSVEDGLNAVSYVRENAEKYGVDPSKIGFMGFSAGGAVTLGVAYEYGAANRPDFLVPVYPWTDATPVQDAPGDAPPLLIVCATDDPLGLARGSMELYNSWLEAEKPVGLHMYAKGGHGFGMRTQGLPSDHWIERFYEWAIAQNLTTAE